MNKDSCNSHVLYSTLLNPMTCLRN